MGLPLFSNQAVQGNLFIHFEIEFPKTLSEQQISQFETLLAFQKPKKSTEVIGKENTHECIPFNKAHINENRKDRKEAYDSGEDEEGNMGGGQRVQCATQ